MSFAQSRFFRPTVEALDSRDAPSVVGFILARDAQLAQALVRTIHAPAHVTNVQHSAPITISAFAQAGAGIAFHSAFLPGSRPAGISLPFPSVSTSVSPTAGFSPGFPNLLGSHLGTDITLPPWAGRF